MTVGSQYLGLLAVFLLSWTALLVEAAWLLLVDWRFGGSERKSGGEEEEERGEGRGAVERKKWWWWGERTRGGK